MATTNFSAGTSIASTWLNDVDALTYEQIITPLLYANLQAAINAASALTNGGAVALPNTVTTLSSGITLPANVTLFGTGEGSVLEFGDTITAITATGTSGTRRVGGGLRNLTIRKIAGTTGHHGIFTLCDDLVIQNVVFDGGLGANPCYVKLRGTRRSNLVGCTFKNGASIIWSSDDDTTTGNWGEANSAIDCTINAAKQGFNITYQKAFSATNCRAIGSTGTFGCGFVIEYENVGVILTNCHAYNHIRDGFYVEGNVAFGCKDIQFIGCHAYNNGEAGLNLDANYKDVQIFGGSYYSNTGAFGAGTGHGIMGAGSQYVTLNGVTLRNNTASGLTYIDAFHLNLDSNNIHDNGTYGIVLTGTKTLIRIRGTDLTNNTSGTISGWTYIGSNEWDQGPAETYTPTFYKSDRTTVITFSTTSVKIKRQNGRMRMVGYISGPSAALDAVTYITIPEVGTWNNASTGAVAQYIRGDAWMDVTGNKPIDGQNLNSAVRISTTAAGDTIIRFNVDYEVV